MVMFDSTIYFFQIDSKGDVVCFKLPLWKLNQTTCEDSDKGIRNLSHDFTSFRFYRKLEVYGDHVDFDVYSDVFNRGNSCVCASVRIYFDDDDTLKRSVLCSRTEITRGEVDDSPFSSTIEPDSHETRFSDKTLRIRDENFEEEDSDEEDSDEEKEDPILVVEANDGTNIYVFKMVDDRDFYCIIFHDGIIHLLKVEGCVLSRLKYTDSEELIAMFEINSVDFSERLEGFGEVDLSCRIVIPDPIQITCNFENHFGDIVLTEQLIIEKDEFHKI
jgi:hypothetical protein